MEKKESNAIFATTTLFRTRNNWSPVFIFKSFFDSEVLGIILERINRSLLMEKPNSKMHNGLFTESGLYQFIGTVLDSIINPKNTQTE